MKKRLKLIRISGRIKSYDALVEQEGVLVLENAVIQDEEGVNVPFLGLKMAHEFRLYVFLLGKTAEERKLAYRGLFKAHLDDELTEIRAAWQTGTPLGNDYFKQQVEAKLKTKVGQARRGRPSKRALTP